MTSLELKQRLIRKINETEDSEILEEMYRLILNEDKDNSRYELTNDQKHAVEEGHAQFKDGLFLNSEQADKEMEEWLGS